MTCPVIENDVMPAARGSVGVAGVGGSGVAGVVGSAVAGGDDGVGAVGESGFPQAQVPRITSSAIVALIVASEGKTRSLQRGGIDEGSRESGRRFTTIHVCG
ncbi:MAG TPA: hypothetical protein VG871_25030 [Vicinamibacterales bacterium]|jgi:hypothetical protein|nr:hypothetical protein [Vicinamibacterales bacterium]